MSRYGLRSRLTGAAQANSVNYWFGGGFAFPSITVEYLIIGGGGAGRDYGGGGAGQVINDSRFFGLTTEYTVTIGAGGAAAGTGADGNNSSITGSNLTTVTALKGLKPAGDAFTAGVSGNGYVGGVGLNYGNPLAGGGGGGAGGAGNNHTAPGTAGAGGIGVANSITGSSVVYGGGGGGGAEGNANAVRGLGGSGGGGNGSDPNGGSGSAGTDNRGGGGGGGRGIGNGSAGGSGVLILKYLTADGTITVGAGLISSIATSGSYKIASITSGTGNVSWA